MKFKRIFLRNVFIILLILTISSIAQLSLPRLSPQAMVTQTVGITEIEITYCRPGVKGRIIWGELVPYDKIWRTGANEATTISFSTDVMVNGNKLVKGKYSLFTIPTQTEWTVIFNKQPDIWGIGNYKEEEDALRIKVKPEAAEFKERMMFYFGNFKENSVDIILHWEKLKVSFNVEVDLHSLVLTEAKNAINWRTPYQASRYLIENDLDLSLARRWINVSLAIQETYWNYTIHAQLLKKEGEPKQAIKALEKAIEMGKSMEQPPYNISETEALLAEWKKNK